MVWSLRAEGHARDARAERLLIDRLRLVLTTMSVGCDFVQLNTTHYGAPNLLDMCGYPDNESERL